MTFLSSGGLAANQTNDLSLWVPESEDVLVVDTLINTGYLVHPNGDALAFPVASGQRKFVCYIGRCYNAATPEKTWVVKSRHVKGDRITFGPSGRFLRLYRNGETYSAYGIHEYAFEDRMFAEGERFRSMGCIIVKTEIMDVLDNMFLQNASIRVITKFGVEDPFAVAFQ